MFVAFFATLLGRLTGQRRHPGWSFSFEMVVRYLRLDWEETADWDFVRLRMDMERRPYPKDYAKRVSREDFQMAGIPTSRFRAPGGSKRKGVILFLHGGSFLFGSAKTSHCEVMSRLAFESGLDVIAPDFRLLPEHGYPAQLEDALSLFQALVSDGSSPENIVVVGDSSGGNLALALALELRDRSATQPRALGLISPWCDLEMPGRTFSENDRYDFGTKAVLERHARAFAGPLKLSDPKISPAKADLLGLCPCLVIVGESEILRDDILALYEKLQNSDVTATLFVAKEMPHNPPAFAALHPEGDASLKRLARYVQEQLS